MSTPTYEMPARAAEGAEQTPWVSPAVLREAVPSLSDELAVAAARLATDLLFEQSGSQYTGLRTSTIVAPSRWAGTAIRLGMGFGTGTAGYGGGCGSANGHWTNELEPGVRGITNVLAATVAGVALTPEQLAAISIVDGRRLRLPAGAGGVWSSPLGVNQWWDEWGTAYSLWPLGCAMCGVPSATVTLEHGTPPPIGGLVAARALGVEVSKYLLGDTKCKLAGNVTQVTRQGVTVLLNPREFLGVPLADQWLGTVNPKRLRSAATVWSPDDVAPERVTHPS